MKFFLLFLIFQISFASSLFAVEQEITISAAISLKQPLEQLIKEFMQQYPKIFIQGNFASSGKLRRQIELGAPVDLYISASSIHINRLIEQKLTEKDSRIHFVKNSLVLVSSSKNFQNLTTQNQLKNLLLNSKVKNFSMGNPRSVPAGHYALNVLKKLDIWKQVKEKAIFGESVKQVNTYASLQEVDLAFVYKTDLYNNKKIRSIYALNEDLTGSINYELVLIKNNPVQKKQVRKFKDFLISKRGKFIFKKFGFLNG
jgi:molybdate transport system substrate-binding protein